MLSEDLFLCHGRHELLRVGVVRRRRAARLRRHLSVALRVLGTGGRCEEPLPGVRRLRAVVVAEFLTAANGDHGWTARSACV